METRGETQKVARWKSCILAGLTAVLGVTGPLARTLAQVTGGSTESQGAQTGNPESGRKRITLRIYNYAQVLPAELTRAEQVAVGIFHKAGIETEWLDCPLSTAELDRFPACQQPLTPSQFVLRLLGQPLAGRSVTHREDMGSALACQEEQAGCSAYLFYQFVRDWATRGDASASQILGHAMAHEVGHLLLGPNTHSRTGIMRGDWSMHDLAAMARTFLYFTPAQSERLQREVSSRGQVRANPVMSKDSPRAPLGAFTFTPEQGEQMWAEVSTRIRMQPRVAITVSALYDRGFFSCITVASRRKNPWTEGRCT